MYFTDIHFWNSTLFLLLACVWGWYIWHYYQTHLKISTPFYKSDLRRGKVLISFFLSFLLLYSTLFWPKTFLVNSQTYLWTNIAFILDVSKSMNVNDISTGEGFTSRLQIAKKTIGDFVVENPNNQYALSIFSGTSDRSVPFTSDTNLFLTILSWVNRRNVSKWGTDIVGALQDSLENFSQEDTSWVVVMFTDGGDDPQSQDISQIQKEMKDKNITFLVIGVWTEKGWYIPLGSDVFGEETYQAYNGRRVVSQLNTNFISSLGGSLEGKYNYLNTLSDETYLHDLISSLWEKVHLSKQTNWLSLQYLFIVLSSIFFIVWFMLQINFWVKLWNRK